MTKRVYKRKPKKKKSGAKPKFLLILLGIIAILYLINNFEKTSSDNDYSNLNGLKEATLKTELHKKIRKHKYLDFDYKSTARYWWDNYYTKTDWHPKGYYWDMYSNDKYGTYLGGKEQNREHLMPRSWWGYKDKYSSYDANGDLHNLYPANAKANSIKSNLPLGEVGIAKFNNGVSKVGVNTFKGGYRGQVFEPANEYKGDFARVFFYMVTCYQDYAGNWRNDALKSMLQNNEYPTLQPWAIEMLLKWHRADPVSEKEINRNNEVFLLQGNRNPFVDEPELAEYIWGNYNNQTFNFENNKENENKSSKNFIIFFKEILNSFLSELNLE